MSGSSRASAPSGCSRPGSAPRSTSSTTSRSTATRVRSVFLPALELLPNIGLILVLAYGGHQVINGSLTLGSLVAFNVYVVMLIWPLRMLGMILAQAQRAVASSQRVHEVLVAEPQVIDAPHAREAAQPPPRTVPPASCGSRP